MFKTTETAVGAAVATAGTITFDYPANTSAGSFVAYGHKLWVDKHQSLYSSPDDFTVSFGASDITVTYNGATSIPAGSRCKLQANIAGTDDGEIALRVEERDVKRTVLANLVRLDLGSPDVADSNGYVESQNLTALGVFSVDATAAAALAAAALNGTADVPRNVVAAWTGTAVLTITGTDEYGNVIVESSASGTSLVGKKAFKTVTGISTSANITSLTVGTGDVLGLPNFLENEAVVLATKEGSVFYDKSSKFVLNADSPALSSASQVYTVAPVAGHIKRIDAVTNTAVTTADSTITVKAPDGTVGTIVIATAGSAVGVVDSLTSVVNTELAAGETVEFENDAAPDAGAASFSTLVEPGGILAAGDTAEATATTGDVRGTYDPIVTLDGETAVSLFALPLEPKYKGVAQFAG